MTELGIIHKFTKWVILRIESKFEKVLQVIMSSECSDRALQARILQDNHEKNMASITLRSNVVSLIVLAVGILSAILSVMGFID